MLEHNGSCKTDQYIFNHLPKTGGTSLLAICRHNLAASEISPHLREDDILSFDKRWERYRLIAGHFSLLAQARLSQSRYSITLLREPVQAILSTYRFWRALPDSDPLTVKAKELPFADFVRYFVDAPAIIHNRMTHHFAFLGSDSPVGSGDESSLLNAAQHNLAAFDFVCLCEQFERSAGLLCQVLGWRLPEPFPHENLSRVDVQCTGIDKQTMKILLDRNELDAKLYAFGVGLFHERERAALDSIGSQPARRSALAKRNGNFANGAAECAVERNRFVPFPTPYVADRKATIQFVCAKWLWCGQSPRLELDIVFHTRVHYPELIVGVAVHDSCGKSLWGTNTLIEKVQVETGNGSLCRVSFILRFEGPAGRYFVTAALHQLSKAGVHDHWLDRAAFFDVVQPSGGQRTACDIELLQVRSVTD